MRHAIERLLATPRITPRLPFTSPSFSPCDNSGALPLVWRYTGSDGRYRPAMMANLNTRGITGGIAISVWGLAVNELVLEIAVEAPLGMTWNRAL
jgi:hypothetical protein